MKHRRSAFAIGLSVMCSFLLAGLFISTSADSTLITFETFTPGTVHAQDGWSSIGAAGLPGCALYDHEIVDGTVAAWSTPTFGTRSLRISNAVTSGCFGDQTFSKSLADEAGESTATNAGQSGGVRQQHFEAQFDIMSTQISQQTGLAMSIAPDRGDGSRQSYLRFEDGPAGIDVFFDDVQGTTNPATFVETQVAAGLPRRPPHTIRFVMDFYDGPSNDVVKIYIDGNLVHIGTSWENYYRFDSESNIEPVRTVDSLIFRTGGTAVPGNSGQGFVFDNVSLSSGVIGTPSASTVLITPANLSTDGLNNNKWFIYNDGSVADGAETGLPSNSLGSFVTGPGSVPLGVGSAQISVDLDKRRNLATRQYGGTSLGAITALKFSTYNPSAGNPGSNQRSAYLHFNVDFNGSNVWQRRLVYVPLYNGTVIQNTWQEWDAIAGGNAKYVYSGATWPTAPSGPDAGVPGIAGSTLRTWNDILADYPGVKMLASDPWMGLRVGEPYADGYTENMDKFVFGTASTVTSYDFDPDQIKVHIVKKLDGVTATAITAGGYQFPMNATWNAANIGGGSGDYVLGNGHGGAADLYGADTSPMSVPAYYTTFEHTGGATQVLPIGATCAPGYFRLVGYSTSDVSFADAVIKPKTNDAPVFPALTADQYVIVWNETCPTKGSIKVVKNTVGGNSTFYFTGDLGPFNIPTVLNTGSATFNNLTPGSFTIYESAKANWTPTVTSCTVTVTAGAVSTCTFTNTYVPPCTDTVFPVVSLYAQLAGPPKKVVLKATDAGGISSISVIANTNLASVTYSTSSTGTPVITSPFATFPTTVYVFATKLDQNAGSVIGIGVKDKCGNTTNYDPVDVTVNSGRREAVTVEDVAGDENLVKIVNDGLRQLRIDVNGHKLVLDLDPTETRIIDIGRALKPGTDNTITFEGRGPRGADAAVIVYPGSTDLKTATTSGGRRHRHSVHEAKD